MQCIVILLVLVRCVEGITPCDLAIAREENDHRSISIWSNNVSLVGRAIEKVEDAEIQGSLLCRTTLAFDITRPPRALTRRREALITLATHPSYLGLGLRRKKGQELELWHAFVAKVMYAESHGIEMYLFIASEVEGNGNSCGASYEKPSVHYLKIPAVLALFDSGFEVVTYVDLDTAPNVVSISPQHYLSALNQGKSILIGSSNYANTPILMNGGVFIATVRARFILQAWFAARCGNKDQLGLWKSLFMHWSISKPTIFSNYDLAHANALPVLTHELPHLRRAFLSSGCHSDCEFIFRHTGCLIEPLTLNEVSLLPLIPFRLFGSLTLPPLQAEFPHSAWWCHKKCPTPNLAALRSELQSATEIGATRNESLFAIQGQERRFVNTDNNTRTTTTTTKVAERSVCFASTERHYLCPCGRLTNHLQNCTAENFPGKVSPALSEQHKNVSLLISCINEAAKAAEINVHHKHFSPHRARRFEILRDKKRGGVNMISV